jgi:CheY-like chemotaxis protein
MAEQPREYNSTDAMSQLNKQEYHNLIADIEKRMDPNQNAILIVDDERGIRKLVSRSIKRSGGNAVIYEAENGQDAIQKLEDIRRRHKKNPLFIVTDLNMPVMDGWDFIQHLQKEYEAQGKEQGIPVIVLSSTSGEKGFAFMKKSVHSGKAKYTPIVSVAKEVCMDPDRYDTSGEAGMMRWIKHFARE